MYTNDKKTQFINGIKGGIPIALGYFAVAFTLGIAAKKAGITAFQATLMSLTNVTSAGEFAAISSICAGVTYIELMIMQAVINLRYMLMSCALAQRIDTAYPMYHRFIMGFGVTDEIFGVSVAQPGRLSPYYTYGAMSVSIPAWCLGTCLGVVLGSVLPANVVSALSVALYGMFIAIIIPPARDNKIVLILIVVSMLLSCAFTYMPYINRISSGFRVIILTVVIAGAAALLFPIEEDSKNEQ